MKSQYEPIEVEKALYDRWVELGIFTPDVDSKKKPYVIMMPPPNVTGVLHMGHALTGTLEDILVRRKRMQGFNALWLPGTDHAGIATQMVVERMIQKEEHRSRHDLGREEFLKRVWTWKEQCQGTILSQMKRMGFGVDWTRLNFTLDPGLSRAVRAAFVKLYKDGLITREEAITQWCPRCRTALSDLEVKSLEKDGALYHIRYREVGGGPGIVVATTRPETLLGDVAVAVNPEDERYHALVGKRLELPLIGTPIPLIQDAYVDSAFGTGALKITPAHDPNDYAIGKRHGLPVPRVLGEAAEVLVGPYKGLKREQARERIVEDLKAAQLLEKVEPIRHSVGHCDRCATVVEPSLGLQWYVDAKVLAEPAIKAVERGEIRILPVEWEKTYFEWMRNIRPWCISRQLWWGHRIPVFYCEGCDALWVEMEDPKTCKSCGGTKWRQDEDVLDTWFSSGLWPFSTLGWPDKTKDLDAFYPTDVLETGFDILFFWVARMIMMGIRLTGKAPFHTVYLHPIVRDEFGQKMSKTKGNVKDPLEIAERMGADSLRLFFASNAYHGRDVRLTDSQLEGCRHFLNKVWNASRFVLMHFGDLERSNIDRSDPVNQWIWTSFNQTKRKVNESLDEYRFFDAANELYHFLWDTFCFWFIEFIKPEAELDRRKAAKESTAVEVLEATLRLLHPIMPFLTEELWGKMPIRGKAVSIAVAEYPAATTQEFPEMFAKIESVCAVIAAFRKARGVYQVPPGKSIQGMLAPVGAADALTAMKPFVSMIENLAKLSSLSLNSSVPAEAHWMEPVGQYKVVIPQSELGELGSGDSEKALKEKEDALARAEAKLSNETFVGKAPRAVIEGVERQRDQLRQEIAALKSHLSRKP